jgi:CRP-like cAMP-binding protein
VESTEQIDFSMQTLSDRRGSNFFVSREPAAVSESSRSTNRLIAALPSRSQKKFLASCDRVELEFADTLADAGAPIRYAYFPLDSFISLVVALDDDSKLEVGMVGNEGMLGIPLVLGVTIAPQDAIVQGAGSALRMSATAFLDHCERDAALLEVLHRYTYVLMSQQARTAACTRYHVVEARLARWLLMSRDRAQSDHFQLTHRFLAYMLGVRRVGVTAAATSLHKRGIIDYSRGKISILDAAGLEHASCLCYAQDKAVYKRVLRVPSFRRTAGRN